MPIKFITVDSPPPDTVEIAYFLVNDDCDYTHYLENTDLLIEHIARTNCYDMLDSLNATVYVHYAVEIDLDVFILLLHCAVDSPRFTHYLLTRKSIANAWIYNKEKLDDTLHSW